MRKIKKKEGKIFRNIIVVDIEKVFEKEINSEKEIQGTTSTTKILEKINWSKNNEVNMWKEFKAAQLALSVIHFCVSG